MKLDENLFEDVIVEDELDDFDKEFNKYVDVPMDVDEFFEVFDRMVNFHEKK